MKAVPVEQARAGPTASGITEAFDRGVAAGGEAVGVEVTVGVVLGPAVVVVVDDVGADDEGVVVADATVVTATIATTMRALEKARTITGRLRRRLDDDALPMVAMRSCPHEGEAALQIAPGRSPDWEQTSTLSVPGTRLTHSEDQCRSVLVVTDICRLPVRAAAHRPPPKARVVMAIPARSGPGCPKVRCDPARVCFQSRST
jgi:hypothetical protein